MRFFKLILLFLLISCSTQKFNVRPEMDINEFKNSRDKDFSEAFRRAIDSKATIIHVPVGIYKVGNISGGRGCIFSFYGDIKNHSNKTFLFEQGAILQLSPTVPNKHLFEKNCNVFILENGQSKDLSNIKFENLTIDFSNSNYKSSMDIYDQITGVKIVTSRFKNKQSLRKNPRVKNVEFKNTKFINGGSLTIYGGTNINIDGLKMENPKIGLSISTDEHYGLYTPNMKIRNVDIGFTEDYIKSLSPRHLNLLYGFDFSEFSPKRKKKYLLDLDSMSIKNATYCKIQGYGNLNLKNIIIDGGDSGGQACFKINDAGNVDIENLVIKNRIHTKGNRVIDAWFAETIKLENVKIESCNVVGNSALIWIHEDVKSFEGNNISLTNQNLSEYSLISESTNTKISNLNSGKIKLYKSAVINKELIPRGDHKLKIEK